MLFLKVCRWSKNIFLPAYKCTSSSDDQPELTEIRLTVSLQSYGVNTELTARMHSNLVRSSSDALYEILSKMKSSLATVQSKLRQQKIEAMHEQKNLAITKLNMVSSDDNVSLAEALDEANKTSETQLDHESIALLERQIGKNTITVIHRRQAYHSKQY